MTLPAHTSARPPPSTSAALFTLMPLLRSFSSRELAPRAGGSSTVAAPPCSRRRQATAGCLGRAGALRPSPCRRPSPRWSRHCARAATAIAACPRRRRAYARYTGAFVPAARSRGFRVERQRRSHLRGKVEQTQLDAVAQSSDRRGGVVRRGARRGRGLLRSLLTQSLASARASRRSAPRDQAGAAS